MDFSRSVSLLRKRFRLAMERDDFVFVDHDPAFPSMRSFIRYAAAIVPGSALGGELIMSARVDIHTFTLGDFLALQIPHQIGLISIESLVIDLFCFEPIERMARDCLIDFVLPSDRPIIFSECGVSHGGDWVHALARSEAATKISEILYADLLENFGDRTLHSFFLERKTEDGFSIIGDRCRSGMGRPLKPLFASNKSGMVTVNISKYQEEVGTNDVIAYEWNASLRAKDQETDEVRACGMLYKFRRRQGIALGNRLDFMLAADSVADVDVLQASAFLAQVEDAESLIRGSDICIVWLWERRDNAPKGRGAECLRIVLDLLRRRFANMRTVAFNVVPFQFLDWRIANELPSIEVEKQEAIESITLYIEELRLHRFNVRSVFGWKDGDSGAALIALDEELNRTI
jgi:hypothetical protein